MPVMLEEYYSKMDELETKRFPEQTKANASEYANLAEHQIEEAKARVLGWAKGAKMNIAGLEDEGSEITNDEWVKVIMVYCETLLKTDLADRKKKRINCVLVPGTC